MSASSPLPHHAPSARTRLIIWWLARVTKWIVLAIGAARMAMGAWIWIDNARYRAINPGMASAYGGLPDTVALVWMSTGLAIMLGYPLLWFLQHRLRPQTEP